MSRHSTHGRRSQSPRAIPSRHTNRVGEIFDREHHEVGTEIKAITYSAMSIAEEEQDADVFVIVDI